MTGSGGASVGCGGNGLDGTGRDGTTPASVDGICVCDDIAGMESCEGITPAIVLGGLVVLAGTGLATGVLKLPWRAAVKRPT